jgi:hypothetical protein
VIHRPDDGGSKNLRNVGKFVPDYTAQYPRRHSSSSVKKGAVCVENFTVLKDCNIYQKGV